MKHEWNKHEKDFYLPKQMPTLIQVPPQHFIMIKGTGNPNKEDFAERVGVLYSLAYPVKMQYKAWCKKNETTDTQFPYEDYKVFPLEGIWSARSDGSELNKDLLDYTIMIRQPDFVTQEMFEEIRKLIEKKKPHPFLKDVSLGTMEDGLSVQMLHLGPYNDEPASFDKMDMFLKENGYKRLSESHREIYLNDARKTVPEKYKTILRYQITALN